MTSNITAPQQQLFDPALEGTRNVFSSIERTGGRPRVVLTSSIAAMLGKPTDKESAASQQLGHELGREDTRRAVTQATRKAIIIYYIMRR